MRVFPAGKMRKKNKGFTLVELVIVIAILSVLLGILVPSLNSILGFRAKRAASSITAALDKTKTEAMNRLVGEMKLSCESDGYYITYYLYHGKNSTTTEDSPEKIAPANNIEITYTYTYTADDVSGNAVTNSVTETLGVGNGLIITYDRETGAFRPLQSDYLEAAEINNMLNGKNKDGSVNTNTARDIEFYDTEKYLQTITIEGYSSTRVITLNQATGTYTMTVS